MLCSAACWPKVTSGNVSCTIISPSSTLAKDYHDRPSGGRPYLQHRGIRTAGCLALQAVLCPDKIIQGEARSILAVMGTFSEGLAQSCTAFIMLAVTALLSTRKEACNALEPQVREDLRSAPWFSCITLEDSLKACLASRSPVTSITAPLPTPLLINHHRLGTS